MKNAFMIVTLVIITLATYTWFTYTQHFNQDSKDTATSGIFFKTTLNLGEYKNVSTGNNLWGTYNRYTRSDRHSETITVYCNKYCKK